MTQLKAAEQMAAVASEKQQKEANIKEALEEQLAQVLPDKNQGGRGHWELYYISSQSFLITFSCLLA